MNRCSKHASSAELPVQASPGSRVSSLFNLVAIVLSLLAALSNTGRADTPQGMQKISDPLKHLSLTKLGDVEATTASKRPEEVWKTPAWL